MRASLVVLALSSLCLHNAEALACGGWEGRGGDGWHSRSSCFSRGSSSSATSAFAAAKIGGVVSDVLATSSSLGLTFLQTFDFDLAAIDIATGNRIWGTYNFSSGANSSNMLPRPQSIASAAVDDVTGVLFVLVRGELASLDAKTGIVLWSANWPEASGAGGSGQLMLHASAAGEPASLLIAVLSIFSPIPGAVTYASIAAVDVTHAGGAVAWSFEPTQLRSGCQLPVPAGDETLVTVCAVNMTVGNADQALTVFALNAATGEIRWQVPLLPDSEVPRNSSWSDVGWGVASILYDAARQLVLVPTANPALPGVHVFRVLDGSRLGLWPLSTGAPGGGFMGTAVPLRSSSGAIETLLGVTALGGIAVLDVRNDASPVLALLLDLGLGPIANTNYGRLGTGAVVFDTASSTLFTTQVCTECSSYHLFCVVIY